MTLFFIFYLVLLAYVVFILWLTQGLSKVPKDNSIEDITSQTSFSIVVPMRSESKNLPKLFQSISGLSYPNSLFEVMLIDDDSQDDSWILARMFQVKHPDLKIFLLSNLMSYNTGIDPEVNLTPKKKAIQKAILLSSYDYILTTDADVTLPQEWLKCFDIMLQRTKADLLAGGVVVASEDRFLSQYQHFDMLGLQLFGYGSFARQKYVICNGANLCYKKSSYLQANVHDGKENIASGDDIFTLEKFRKLGLKIDFVYDSRAVVWTHAVNTFEALWQQRRRWAKKSIAVDSFYLKGVGLLISLMQLTLVLGLCLGCFKSIYLGYVINAFILKFMVDAWSLRKLAKLQYLGFCWTDFLKVSLVYPFFTLLFAVSSLFGKFDWKGRQYSK